LPRKPGYPGNVGLRRVEMRNVLTVIAVVGALLITTAAVNAAYIVTLEEQGNNVVATGSGSVNTTSLPFRGPFGFLGFSTIIPLAGSIVIGEPVIIGPVPGFTEDIYGLPDSILPAFGPPPFTSTDTPFHSGDLTGIRGLSPQNQLFVPHDYTSGGPLTGTATWIDATFVSLGVTPGTYVTTWGSGANADSFTIQIGPAAVPEPSSLALLALPLGLVLLLATQHRRDIPTELHFVWDKSSGHGFRKRLWRYEMRWCRRYPNNNSDAFPTTHHSTILSSRILNP